MVQMTAIVPRSLLALTVAAALILAACKTQPSSTPPDAGSTEAPRTATLSEIVGDVTARRSVAEAFAQAIVGLVLSVGGQVQTGDDSRARIDFSGGSIVRLADNTSLTVETLTASDTNPQTRFQFDAGKLWISWFGGVLELETPVGVAAVRGSFAVVEYTPGDPNDPNDDVLILDCLEGLCSVRSATFDETLGNLERVILIGGGPPQRSILTNDDVLQFVQANPETGQALVATLAAAPTRVPAIPSATPSLTPAATITIVIPSTALPLPTPIPTVSIIGRHTVRSGETLLCIGRAYGVLPDAIAQANGLVSPFNLSLGQVLNIPAVQWTAIAPGPVCAAQFISPFPGLPVVPTLIPIPTATPVPTASGAPSPTGTASASPTPTPTDTPTIPLPDRQAPALSAFTANPTVVPPCDVTFAASAGDPSGVAAVSLDWTSYDPAGRVYRTGSASMALSSGTTLSGIWSATVRVTTPLSGTLLWSVTASDSAQNVTTQSSDVTVASSSTCQ